MEGIRLQKYLAEAGIASRRKAEEIIAQGRVSIDGNVVTETGVKVLGNERITVDGKPVSIKGKKLYIVMNKPAGYVTTVKDQFSRKTVIDLLEGLEERIFPVGRLDYETTGLLILTNDGGLTYKLTHPAHEVDKKYEAKVKGIPLEADIRKLEKGVSIDGFVTSPASARLIKKLKENAVLEIVIHEGKNRQVRKMCEAVGYPVISLKRTAIGDLSLKGLELGKWRYLTGSEIDYLKNL